MGLDSYFGESLRYDGVSWRFTFDYQDMVDSQRQMNGNYWNEWKQLRCPTLLLHGTKSWACQTVNILAMQASRPSVELRLYDEAGHTLRDECRPRYCKDVAAFLQTLQQ